MRSALAGGGLVTFATDGTISLASTLVITNATTLDGTGHTVALSGAGAVRVLQVLTNTSLVLNNLTVADGYVYNGAGAGLLNQGSTTVLNCTFSNNVTAAGSPPLSAGGGAISHPGSALRISGSTFVQNRTAFVGAAVHCGVGMVNGATGNIGITNCTFYGNSGPSFNYGAAIGTAGPLSQPITVVNCTFAANTNGAISFATSSSSSAVTVMNSVFAASVNASNAVGVVDGGHNICSDNSLPFVATTSRTNTNPWLGPIGNWGGPTWTVPLLPTSPAHHWIENGSAPPTDQRGVARLQGQSNDSGAFEGIADTNYVQSVRFSSTLYTVNQGAGTAWVQLERLGDCDGGFTVGFSAQAGTATAGVDFVATNVVLTFTNREMLKSVPISILAGQSSGGDKTVLLTLHDPAGAGLSAPNTATLTIAQSTGYQVLTNFTDAGLRAAVANGGRILFTNDGTVTLTNTLSVTTLTSLEANGHQVALSGNQAVRLFYVGPGGNLTLRGLTLTKGAMLGANGSSGLNGAAAFGGAAFVEQGVLNLVSCHVWTNMAIGGAGTGNSTSGGDAGGGAIYLLGGTLTISNSDLVGNQVIGGAGGTNTTDFVALGNGGRALGGALYNAGGTLTLSSNSFLWNQALGGKAGVARTGDNAGRSGDALGGAICQVGGTGTVAQCSFEANQGASQLPPGYLSGTGGGVWGGAVYNGSGSFTFESAQFTDNAALGGPGVRNLSAGDGRGGAIANLDVLQIRNCWLEGNQAYNGASGVGGVGVGGAIYNAGQLALNASLLDRNAATGLVSGTGYGTGQGGAIENEGSCGLTNVTLYANQAVGNTYWAGTHSYGGGLYSSSTGTVAAVNCTFAANSAQSGGGIVNGSGSVYLLNMLLADNTPGTNASGAVTDGGHNISSDGSCNFTAPGSRNFTAAVLGPLGDYGGPTPTLPLLAGSPAIDGGTSSGAPNTDQRGRARPFGAAVDVGAFESSPPYVISGRVSGATLKDEVQVSSATGSVFTTNQGHYRLEGFSAGTYAVVPSHSNYLFSPASQNVTVGPDQLTVDFQAYRWDTLSVDSISNGMLQVVLATTNGSSARILTSSNLSNWFPYLTNQVGTDHAIRCVLPATGPQPGFYRAIIP